MGTRSNHFMPTSLHDIQFATLEPLAANYDAISFDIDELPEALIDQIINLPGAR